MAVKVSFADLTHMGQVVAANTFPLGIGYVAAYANQQLGEEIDFEIFKYPDDFSSYLRDCSPHIAGFSSYSWAIRLNYEYARIIKETSPTTVTVFGGPNFPSTHEEQKEFLNNHPAIDCYLEFEGERAFVGLFNALKQFDFNWEEFKRARTLVPNVRYLVEGELVTGDLEPKTKQLDDFPSP